jgi:hypothetical protein
LNFDCEQNPCSDGTVVANLPSRIKSLADKQIFMGANYGY